MEKIRVDQRDGSGVEARLRWFGHLHSGYIGQKMLRIELPGRRKRG